MISSALPNPFNIPFAAAAAAAAAAAIRKPNSATASFMDNLQFRCHTSQAAAAAAAASQLFPPVNYLAQNMYSRMTPNSGTTDHNDLGNSSQTKSPIVTTSGPLFQPPMMGLYPQSAAAVAAVAASNSFQNLLANISAVNNDVGSTNRNSIITENGAGVNNNNGNNSSNASPSPLPSISPDRTTTGSSPTTQTSPLIEPVVAVDRRSSSIASLRLKAREHELRLEMMRQNSTTDLIS